MRRIEPTIGSFETRSDIVAPSARLGVEHRPSRKRSLAFWVLSWSLLAVTFVGLSWAAFYFGIVGTFSGAAISVLLPKSLLFGGLGLVLFSQLVAVVLIFSVSFAKGVLCFLVPGYWLLALRQEGFYFGVAGILVVGCGAYSAGILLAS